MLKKIAGFLKCDSGATAIEYALVATLISVAIIGGATTLGTALEGTYSNVSSKM